MRGRSYIATILFLTISLSILAGGVKSGGEPPVADFTWNVEYPEEGEKVTFDASLSHDPDGRIIEYCWTCRSDPNQIPQFMGYGKILTYSWNVTHTYWVTLRVTDNDGMTDYKTKTIVVDNIPPTIYIKRPKPGIYIKDRLIIPLSAGIIAIGELTVHTPPDDDDSGIDRVEFYVDATLRENFVNPPYQWVWDEKTLGLHTFQAVAYDRAGNSASVKAKILMINP